MRGRPPWWPEGEAWPPADRAYGWRRGRARFLRRVGCLFAVLLVLSAVGLVALASMVSAPAGRVIAAAILVLLLAVFFGAMRRFGFPLGDIVGAADRVASGDLSARVPERGPPSLRSVARAFNSMTARLQAQDQQRRHLMADIAHELRTPLTVMQGRLEGLLDGVYPRDDAGLTAVLEETRTLARLVDDLRTLAHAESGMLALQKEPTDLAILVHEVVGSFAAEAGAAQVTVRVASAADLPLVEVDPLRIRQVLANLLSNALRHTAPGGSIAVAAEAVDGSIAVRVTDTGAGIPAEELPKIFDRFYKGPASRGSGLGLTIARNLVVAHGGEIRAESQVGQGTTITVLVPTGSDR
jgi:two-component system OmpR family sensor kinase/two-component system sensor histidine kinase BaeS